MITTVPRKVSVESVNGYTPNNSGAVVLPIDNQPTAYSSNLVTSGGVQTQLQALSDRIGDVEAPAQVWQDMDFSIGAGAWEYNSGTEEYEYTFFNAAITSTSGVFVFYSASMEEALTASIEAEKVSGGVKFSTPVTPATQLDGTIRIVDSVQGVLPPQRGGTGADSPTGALANLGAAWSVDIAAPFSLQKTYSKGEYCLYGNRLYQYTNNTSSAGAWDDSKWVARDIGAGLADLISRVATVEAAVGTMDQPAQVWQDLSFSIPASYWTQDGTSYYYDVESALLTATAGVFVLYDTSYRTSLNGDISAVKSTGKVRFTTTAAPTADTTLTGVIRIIDSLNGTVLVSRGGTGANTAEGARTNLNVPKKPIDVTFTVSTTAGTVYTSTVSNAAVNANMKGIHIELGDHPEIFKDKIRVDTSAGSVTLSCNTVATGTSTVIVTLIEE